MGESEQIELVRSSLTAARSDRVDSREDEPRLAAPIAQVVVDTGLAHLDRPFDYRVPPAMSETARPGVRVKVRFAGRDLDGFIVARSDEAEYPGRLSPIRRVVSDEPVLTPAVLACARSVGQRHAGTLGDVLRLAVPPRHARAEKALARSPGTHDTLRHRVDPEVPGDGPPPGAWARYTAGPAYLRHLRAGEAPWACWSALPAPAATLDWPRALAEAAGATLASGRGSIIVVPDHRDVARVDGALTEVLGPGQHVRLTADQGPQARYTAFLKALRGHVPVVVGTRAAAFAPVQDLGLVAWWDDGDDLHQEPRAPYPHVRDILTTRAELEGTAVLTGGFARSVEVEAMLESGRARPVVGTPATVRGAAARVTVAGEGVELERDPMARSARLPSVAWRAARAALERGPVLVQVPRRGYLPAMSCQGCRRPARCPHCRGPLELPTPDAAPTCRWCGRPATDVTCPTCGDHRLRAAVVGSRRTAEELGRAFPGVPVHTSGAGSVRERVDGTPSLVIATPGAEPVAEGGYAAALLLDAWALLERPSLRAGEEAVRRWLGAMGLVRGSADAGAVVLCGTPAHVTLPAVEAVVRWDPAWFARRELAERVELGLPPAVWMAQLLGSREALRDALRWLDLGREVSVDGPVPLSQSAGPIDHEGATAVDGSPASPPDASAAALASPSGDGGDADAPGYQVLLRADLDRSAELASRLVALRAFRSAQKAPGSLRVDVDPVDLLA